MEFASKREFKKFTEAFTAFLARRETREIRRQAKNVAPNAGFRLINSNTALAARMRASAERMALERKAELNARRKVKIAGKPLRAGR